MATQLYRYFDCAEHADQFIAGVVSMGLLDAYRDVNQSEMIGAARFDGQEGSVSTSSGLLVSHKYLGNLIRVVCCSTVLDERLKAEFGGFIVRIEDAQGFGRLLAEALEAKPYVKIGLQHQAVSYGDEPIPISDYEFIESQLFTKPASYSYQHEYRYAFVERDELEGHEGHLAATLNPTRKEVRLPASAVGGLLQRLC